MNAPPDYTSADAPGVFWPAADRRGRVVLRRDGSGGLDFAQQQGYPRPDPRTALHGCVVHRGVTIELPALPWYGRRLLALVPDGGVLAIPSVCTGVPGYGLFAAAATAPRAATDTLRAAPEAADEPPDPAGAAFLAWGSTTGRYGSLLFGVRPEHRHRGVAVRLLLAIFDTFPLDLSRQVYSPAGLAVVGRVLDRVGAWPPHPHLAAWSARTGIATAPHHWPPSLTPAPPPQATETATTARRIPA